MALDNANFIAELSITDPPGSDPLSQGDDQIRTIKRATFQSFPNIDAAVSLTTAQMNLAAIKNEANIFTNPGNQFATRISVKQSGVDVAELQFLNDGGFTRWILRQEGDAQTNDWLLQRRDAAGLFVDEPFSISATTGVMDFLHVPTVAGAPLWVAGELRIFVTGQTPGTNWFIANGTNGTVDVGDRMLVARGTSGVGTLLAPNLVGSAVAQVNAGTAITAATMPSHRHRIRSGGASGITDIALGNVSNQTVVGGNRGNTSSAFFDTNSGGQQFIENTGSGGTHTHTASSSAVTENGTGRDTVRPLSIVVDMFQYVP